MNRTAGVLLVALLVFVACTSGDAGTSTLPSADGTSLPGSGSTSTTAAPSNGSSTTTSGPSDSTTTTLATGATSSTTERGSSSTSTTPPTPTTKPNQDIPGGSTPVTDDSTPGGRDERPSDAEDVTVSSTQLFVIGGDTLYLVVEGTKVAACQRLDFITEISGSVIDIDLFSVPDDDFCTPSTDYKDSLALGAYGAGTWEIVLNGNEVATAEL